MDDETMSETEEQMAENMAEKEAGRAAEELEVAAPLVCASRRR